MIEAPRTVTIVTSDLKGSTSLGERLDPESLREVLTQYFDEMREVLESHGGVIEKIIGDAIIAVFGLPDAREDDALRAVRAAAQTQRTLTALFEHVTTHPDDFLDMDNRESGESVERLAIDFIAGMTDRYLLEEHARLATS